MWNRAKLVFFVAVCIPGVFNAQDKQKKEKFASEKRLYIKIGSTLNYVNTNLYGILNSLESDVFTPAKNSAFNPSADLEFDNQFSKHFGINVDLGFMQTRQYYHYEKVNATPAYGGGGPIYTQNPNGVILCNIPHVNISPSFYISNTRFNVGLGYYKYYYAFKPANVGNIFFDLNSEGWVVYSTVGITQSVDVKAHLLTVSINCFGLTRK
jgi:hypothetical protein